VSRADSALIFLCLVKTVGNLEVRVRAWDWDLTQRNTMNDFCKTKFCRWLTSLPACFLLLGEISGWIEVKVCLEENLKRLYGWDPFECPPRPPDELNMVTFQLHIARIKVFIEDAKDLVDTYQHMVSWKDPLVTIISLVVFVSFCLFFNAEYSGR
jgi:hypothetical protein